MVFLRLPFEKGIKCVLFENDTVDVREIRYRIATCWGVNDLKLYYNGKLLDDEHFVPRDATLQGAFSLPGGKGGFGSMLRAIGAQIEKTTNREACRDLSGRRLRDINEEQRLKKWISKESEREAEKARRRQARIERLKLKPKHNFVDFEYEKEISQLPERVDEALHAGMEKASKRPKTVEAISAPPSKKKKLWMDEDLSGSSDSDSQEASSSSGNTNSQIENAHSSRSEVSESNESSNDGHSSEAKHDAADRVVGSEEEEASLIPDAEVSSNDGPTPDLTSQEAERVPEKESLNTNAEEEQATSNKDAAASCSHSAENTPEEVQIDDVDLLSYASASELESLGLERLKAELMSRGLKCGGTVSERALRLWRVRGLEPHEYPSNLLAKKKK